MSTNVRRGHLILDGHLGYDGKPLEVHYDSHKVKAMSQRTLDDVVGRYRRNGTMPLPALVERLLDHIEVVSHHYGFLREERDSNRAWGERLADDNSRLRARVTELFGLLTNEQKAILRTRDDARRSESKSDAGDDGSVSLINGIATADKPTEREQSQ